MTPGIGFAFVAMLCFGVGDLIYKRAGVSGIPVRQFIMMHAWIFCPAITLYALATGTLHPGKAMLWGALAGLCSLTAFYNFARSLVDGAVSTNAPIFRLNFTLTAALAIALLGEPLTLAKAFALAFTLMAVWLLLTAPGAGAGRSSASSLVRVVAATGVLGLANFLLKIGLIHGATPESLITAQAWAFTLVATLVAFLPERRLAFASGGWRYAVPVAIVFVSGFVLLAHGLAYGPASVLVPVAQMGFVFTALLGAVIFRERLDLRKGLGLLIATAALVLFAVS